MKHFKRSDLPEEMPDELKDQYERSAMEGENTVNETVNFFRTLNPEQLAMMVGILTGLTHEENGPIQSAHYAGICNALLVFVHNRCAICFEDHEAELFHTEGKRVDISKPAELVATEPNLPTEEFDPDFTYPAGVKPFLTRTDVNNMREYHLDDAWSELEDGSYKFIGFACTGITGKPCGLIYPSLADRMLKAPDDCHGCHNKNRWG